ncbi:hypothetical protein BJ742DRAFT_814103 [Cladochytrium replicatum]|nr:hypothetical protein BJ742DRAFT_814103 [Cladochytrium replicatum]
MERGSRTARVKNKNPAPVQITAEQILRETHERQEAPAKVPRQQIADKEELDEYRLGKRKSFEDAIRRNRNVVGLWLKYAQWEESQGEMERSRSILERALQGEYRNPTLWIRYIEMEIRHKNINMARNILDRATSILPRLDQFWYKYVWMEELLGNVAGTRQVFERWMQWEPSEDAWMAYVKMEQRYHETERAREVFRRFVTTHPEPKNWLKWAKFEEQHGKIDTSRAIYEECIEKLGEELIDQNIYVSFAKFETRMKEIDRARAIYKFGLDKLPKGKVENLYNTYTQFEKQYGNKDGIEDVIITKRRNKYEEELQSNSGNYDVWFDYIRLEESTGDEKRIREVYERAIAVVPPVEEKRFWRRYIYIWIYYAIWEELDSKDTERARQIYQQCIQVIPHKVFTFSKVWLLYAQFLIRRSDLNTARKTLGAAIGMCPKDRLFRGYIQLEMDLHEYDRVRALYQKYLEWNPTHCAGWIKYAGLEEAVDDVDRSRGIFEIAVGQPELDMPEVLWKGYIDFEVRNQEWERARALYERLLEKTEHVKVWVSYAIFEFTSLDHEDIAARLAAARKVFEKAVNLFKQRDSKDERVIVLESWRDFEKEHQSEDSPGSNALKTVLDKMPKTVKKRRKADDGTWEEYYDYIFPDDETDRPNFKLLAMAHQWKMKLAQQGQPEDEEDDDEDEGEGNGSGSEDSGGQKRGGEDRDDSDDEREDAGNGNGSESSDEDGGRARKRARRDSSEPGV